MIIFKKVDQLKKYLTKQRGAGKKIGFVPTMGALHQGHISLIHSSEKINDITVCSIFINPTQFNNPDDFKHYPVTLETDIELLVTAECSILFLPLNQEIYPEEFKKKSYDLGNLETVLEGAYRPGHFQGVCQVVDRLLEIVSPDNLYLGQKDFQQCMVIKKLIELTGREANIHVEILPTVREDDGLAMSSRNLRLNKEQRETAPAIFDALQLIKMNFHQIPGEELVKSAKEHLVEKGFVVDYVLIADAVTLEPSFDISKKLVALVAAHIGSIRLIDNLLLN